MSVFRSEMQVPINKGDIEARNNVDSNVFSDYSKFSCLSLDQWNDKFKQKLKIDDHLLQSFSSNNLLDKYSENNFSNILSKNLSSFDSENIFRQFLSQIAKGMDGNMHFTAKFDVKDVIDPDKIKVFVKDTSLIISVEIREVMNPKCSTLKEFTKKFNLPPNIISESITCTISTDNILILDGILDLSYDQRRNASVTLPCSSSHRSQSLVSSSSSSSLLNSPSFNEKYKVNVHIGNHYNPQDITIKTKDDKIFIKARHEEKSDSRTNYREFSKEIKMPDRVDPLSLSAIFNNGCLCIEAPLSN